MPETPQGVPTDREVMTSGPHAGKTFNHLWENEHQYTQWVRLTADTHPEGADPAIYRLAAYLTRKDQIAEGLIPLPESDVESPPEEITAMDCLYNEAQEDFRDI